MAAKIHRLEIGLILTVVLSLAIVLLAPSPVVPAKTYEVGTESILSSANDFSAAPPYIVDDANKLATELFGNDQEKHQDFASQLLALYLAAKDKDIVIIFNPGGWGWTPIEASPHGRSFVTGIESELTSLGYTVLFLNHLRTHEGWQVYPNELVEMVTRYPSKAKDLATRVEFLTNHIPDLRVIIIGESEGTIICDSVMNILRDNPQVYSIQLGPPFWHKNIMLDRTLVMTSNGIIPDSFSQGDIFTIIRANLEALFGISQAYPGKILLYIGSPGHDYSWQYDSVRSKIIGFFSSNFGTKQ